MAQNASFSMEENNEFLPNFVSDNLEDDEISLFVEEKTEHTYDKKTKTGLNVLK